MYCSSRLTFIRGKSPLDTLTENNLNSFSMKFQKEKIILTGYRATGKSSIGKILADLLDFGFVDTDEVIEKRQGETIADMVDRGWWTGAAGTYSAGERRTCSWSWPGAGTW
jgi:hypothetical protein